MTCANCARHVTDAIQGVPGVRDATVSLGDKNAVINWNDGAPEDIPAVVKAVAAIGYKAGEIRKGSDEVKKGSCGCQACHEKPSKNFDAALWLGVVVTVVLMAGDWIFHLMMVPWFRWLSFILAALVQCIAGAPFYRGAWQQLKVGRANMDALVALGSTTAFGYSAWVLFSHYPGEIYFMEAAAIITLITIGHRLEAMATEKAGAALKSLLNLAPPTARRIRKAEDEKPKPDLIDLKTATFQPTASPAQPKPLKITLPGSPSSALNPAVSSSSAQNPKSGLEPKVPDPGLRPSSSALEDEVPVAELKADDLIALRPGDRIPVDGVVVEGASAVDESTLTGESVPVEKKPGHELYAGTVNVNGRVVMRVTATGDATALAHVISAVRRAQTSRADIQRLGDSISNIFVPVVVVIALLAGLWWGLDRASAEHVFDALAPYLWPAHAYLGAAAGFIVAASVLIVACPCAMGLATPAAIMAAANAAARRGILIRDGIALEKAGKITAVVFDKTGTLTEGKMEVGTFIAIDPARGGPDAGDKPGNNVELLQATSKLAAALARHSSHPVSRAITELATGEVQMTDWREIQGSGIEARVLANDGHWKVVLLGSPRWFTEIEVDLSAAEKFISDHSLQGSTVVAMAIDHRLVGLFAVRDTIKPRAAEVIAQLQQQGLKTFLVTGDHVTVAMNIAKRIGISGKNVFAEMRPAQKAAVLKELQAKGDRIAFVGDGINDAPALTQADLGIAVGKASDIAREAADIILLKSEVETVPEALGLARAALSTIKQNLFWAFFYNALGVPLAALGFISPIFCAAAMGVSDLVVIGNALRLLKWKP